MLVFFWLLVLRLQNSKALSICSECDEYTTKVLNTSIEFKEIFRNSFPTDYRFNLSELRPGICEATVAFVDGKFYLHQESRTVSINTRDEKNTLYLRHKEFLEALIDQIRQTEHYIGNSVPNFIFNLETQDNPTCKYPHEETQTGLVRVKGLVHHSFCSRQLCDLWFVVYLLMA